MSLNTSHTGAGGAPLDCEAAGEAPASLPLQLPPRVFCGKPRCPPGVVLPSNRVLVKRGWFAISLIKEIL